MSAQLAKNVQLIRIGAARLGLIKGRDRELYEIALHAAAGVTSSKALSLDGSRQVLEHFAKLGWRPTAAKSKRVGSTAVDRLALHIWGSLFAAGKIESADRDGAFLAWVKKWSAPYHATKEGWSRFQLCPSHVKQRLIEQLKKWAAREKVEWR